MKRIGEVGIELARVLRAVVSVHVNVVSIVRPA